MKIWDTPEIIAIIILNFEQCGVTIQLCVQKMQAEMANSGDFEKTAPEGTVWSGSSLLAQTCLSEYSGSLQYYISVLAAPVAEWLSSLIFSSLNRSSSHPSGFDPSSGHVRQAKFCLWVARWFSRGSPFFCPTLHLTWLKMSESWRAVKPKSVFLFWLMSHDGVGIRWKGMCNVNFGSVFFMCFFFFCIVYCSEIRLKIYITPYGGNCNYLT